MLLLAGGAAACCWIGPIEWRLVRTAEDGLAGGGCGAVWPIEWRLETVACCPMDGRPTIGEAVTGAPPPVPLREAARSACCKTSVGTSAAEGGRTARDDELREALETATCRSIGKSAASVNIHPDAQEDKLCKMGGDARATCSMMN